MYVASHRITIKLALLLSYKKIVYYVQCVICPKKGGRVEYVNTCKKELCIVFYHRVKQFRKGGSNSPNPPGKSHPDCVIKVIMVVV